MRNFAHFALFLVVVLVLSFVAKEFFSQKTSEKLVRSNTPPATSAKWSPASSWSSISQGRKINSSNFKLPKFEAQSTPSFLNPPANPHQVDVENVQTMLRDYRNVLGENPVGTNAEIMHAVMGGNVKQIDVGPPEGQHLNEKGELVDPWGTPYFFHQLAKDHMEIRSAGPDRIMWTEDDLVAQ